MSRFISHVQVPVQDLEKAAEWYVQYLDCEFLANFGDFALVRFKNDGVNIFLWKTSDETTASFTVNGKPRATIGFEVDDMDALREKILQSGTRIEEDGLAAPDDEGRRFLIFTDLYGNWLVAHTA